MCVCATLQEVELTQFMGKDNVPFHTVIFPATQLGTGGLRFLLLIENKAQGKRAFPRSHLLLPATELGTSGL